MQKKWKRTLLSRILSTMLIVAMAFSMTACGGSNADKETPNVGTEGETMFTFVVVDGEGKETTFEIHTDKTTVGDALLEEKLIEGEDGPYGLYVKVVNGITADYDVDGTYWAFYINGEMAMTGVDATNVEAGATYTFKVEK